MQQTFENKSLVGRGNEILGIDLLYSQLFSSMLTSSGLYLSNTNFSKKSNIPNKSKNKALKLLKKTKDNIVKLITKPADGIERLLTDPKQELMEIQENIEINRKIKEPIELKYSSQASNFSPIKALRKLYSSFVSYGKKGYAAIKTNTKKVAGNVKLTIYKFANTSWFLKASLNPQWNFAPGSALDIDASVPEETSSASISEENAKYQIGHQYLRYR